MAEHCKTLAAVRHDMSGLYKYQDTALLPVLSTAHMAFMKLHATESIPARAPWPSASHHLIHRMQPGRGRPLGLAPLHCAQ